MKKPKIRAAIKRSPLPPRKKYLPRSTKPIRQVNADALARRRAKQRKHYASAEYRELRIMTFARDGSRCTFVAAKVGGPEYALGPDWPLGRCGVSEGLHCHETSYQKRKAVTLCAFHHALVERTYHPNRRNGR